MSPGLARCVLVLQVVDVVVGEPEPHAMEDPPELRPRDLVPGVPGARARVAPWEARKSNKGVPSSQRERMGTQ